MILFRISTFIAILSIHIIWAAHDSRDLLLNSKPEAFTMQTAYMALRATKKGEDLKRESFINCAASFAILPNSAEHGGILNFTEK